MRVLLITPPLLQCNSPYPATPVLAAWLKTQGVDARQWDASLALVLRLLSADGIERIVAHLARRPLCWETAYLVEQASEYRAWVGPAVRFLQGKEPALAYRLARLGTLPEGPRFAAMHRQELDAHGSLGWAFGNLGVQDQARYLASLFVDDVAAAVTLRVDPGFGLARYEEQLCQALPSFDPLRRRLDGPRTLVDELIDELAAAAWQTQRPDLVGLTVPFPGTLYGALRLARAIRRAAPGIPVVLGGGYVSTELRELSEPALFDDVDFVCLDNGFQALAGVLRFTAGGQPQALVRTFRRVAGQVRFEDHDPGPPPRHGELPPPDYTALPLADYLPLTESLNPMQVLWSSQRWNKLQAAHGCYWHRCTFCDTSLDYIRRFEQPRPAQVVDWLAEVARQTGSSGFHFVDEALPPALVRGVCAEVLRRGMVVTWWGNLRLDHPFDADLARLMAAAGCVAVTAGLEAFDDRLLAILNKGVSVDDAARVCAALADAGIMVHAYLMHGVPTQTAQETVDTLERVRQMFRAGLLRSAHWHRFAATVHSPVGRRPECFGVRLEPTPSSFGRNEVRFTDGLGVDHGSLGAGLRTAVYNYMHGIGLEEDVRVWFDGKVPRSRVRRGWLRQALAGGLDGGARRPRAGARGG
jgi:radical SAM superfamily enzyme YgiQ (UPF0313 family)